LKVDSLNSFRLMLLVLAMLPAALVAEERLGYVAEHMISRYKVMRAIWHCQK